MFMLKDVSIRLKTRCLTVAPQCCFVWQNVLPRDILCLLPDLWWHQIPPQDGPHTLWPQTQQLCHDHRQCLQAHQLWHHHCLPLSWQSSGWEFLFPPWCHLWYSMFDLVFSRQAMVALFHPLHTSINHNARVRISLPSTCSIMCSIWSFPDSWSLVVVIPCQCFFVNHNVRWVLHPPLTMPPLSTPFPQPGNTSSFPSHGFLYSWKKLSGWWESWNDSTNNSELLRQYVNFWPGWGQLLGHEQNLQCHFSCKLDNCCI